MVEPDADVSERTSQNSGKERVMRRAAKVIMPIVFFVATGMQVVWSLTPQLPVPISAVARSSGTQAGQSATLLPSGKWLLLGGQSKTGPLATAVIEDPATGTMTTLKFSMLFARSWHSATLLPNGLVLIVGGVGANGKIVQNGELFDPNSTTSGTQVAGLIPRAHHCATLLTDGTVLIAGGEGADGVPIEDVEEWDSHSQQVSVLASRLESRRRGHIASLLPDGTVLLWGGTDGQGNPLSYADLYNPSTQSFSYTTYSLPATADLNLSYLEFSLPADGENNVPIDAIATLRFSKLLQVQTLNSSSVTLTGPDGEVAIKVVPAEAGRLAFITPVVQLQPGRTYLLAVDGAIDAEGLLFVRKTITFTTAGPSKSSDSSASSSSKADSKAPSAQDLPPLVAPPGVTALSGQALLVNGQPLPDVTISIGTQKTHTDRTGRFLLQRIEPGHQVFVIEGHTANYGTNSFGLFEVGTEVRAGITNVLTYKVWMTPLDTAHAVSIPSPTTTDTIVTTPALPGLKLDLPPDTAIYDHYGHVVHQLTITPIRLDRPPFPIPQGLNITFYFTIQPGGSYLRVGGGKYPRGARLIYPNVRNLLPGTPFSFWNYDPDQKGWFVYGMGRVSPDRKDVIPNPGVSLYEFTGAMDGGGGGGPSPGPPPGFPPCPGCGDPVDPTTGLFVYQHQDFYLPDVIPIDVTRTYRQGDTTSRAFGLGTTVSYDIFPVGDQFPYTYMDLVLPDGGRVHYYRISSGTSYTDAVFMHTSTPTKFYGSTISWDPAINVNGGGWLLRFKDGTTWGFPDSYQATTGAQGSLLFVQDRYGNKLTISRDHTGGLGTGNITQITSSNGRWLQFTYDSCNRIHQITDNIARTVQYKYDSSVCTSGRLQTVTDQNGNTTTYGYQGATVDQMTSITDGRQIKYLQNVYDSSNRVHQQILANQGTFTFNYTTDGSGNITQTTITDPNNNVRQLNFSAPAVFQSGFQTGGYLTSETLASGKPEEQTFTYNLGTVSANPGNFVQSITDPLGRTTSNTYDGLGNLTSVTRLAGTATPSITTYTYEPMFNRIASITDPMSNTSTFTYNDSTNQIVTSDPLGNQWTASLNSLGQVVSSTDPAGATRQFGYSGADQTSVTDARNNVTTYVYDGVGRKVSTTDALGERTSYSYDGLNNLLTRTDPLNEVTQYSYDQNSNLTSVTDPKNSTNPTQFLFNNMDQIYQRTDPLGNSESYQYDQNGNLTCHTDRKGQITVFGYDGIDRRISAGYGGATCTATAFQNTTTYKYDGANRLTVIADSLSGTINRKYDGLDDLNYESTPQGTINYTFDSGRRRTSMTVTGQAQVIYDYDAASHLKHITQGSSVINLEYDNVGRRSSVALPNGIAITYLYDLDSHTTQITYQDGSNTLGGLTYGYDALGRKSQVTGSYAQTNLPSAVSSATYNVANQIATWAGTTISYDLNGNLTNDGANMYTWDLRNHLSAISGGSTASLQYDGVQRRINKTFNGTSTSFLFDGKNVVQELSGSTPTANLVPGLQTDEIFARTDSAGTGYFLDDALGSTLALTSPSGAVQTTYNYEPFGNTTTGGTSSTNAFQYTGRENDGTGLYFYRARYYKPGFERFVSEDPIDYKGGVNLFEYVRDNPVNLKDACGLKPPPEPVPAPPPPLPPCTVFCVRLGLTGVFFCWDNGFGQIRVCGCPAAEGFHMTLPFPWQNEFSDYVPCSVFYKGEA
jgi:RHS repeat-associated protein